MKANELRIGNYLDYFGKAVIVGKIEFEYIGCAEKNSIIINCYNQKDAFKPIPLTEEWLLKFGFEHKEFSFDKGSFFLSKRTGKKEYLYQAHINRFQIKYVHQLQNLYFALTNNELTL